MSKQINKTKIQELLDSYLNNISNYKIDGKTFKGGFRTRELVVYSANSGGGKSIFNLKKDNN